MNSIQVIHPYKDKNQWVFDDPRVGLVKEPFVAGIDDMFDRLTNGASSFKLLFSGAEFPGFNIKLDWLRAELGGNWYSCQQLGLEGWLCPALYKYFEFAPMELYGEIKLD